MRTDEVPVVTFPDPSLEKAKKVKKDKKPKAKKAKARKPKAKSEKPPRAKSKKTKWGKVGRRPVAVTPESPGGYDMNRNRTSHEPTGPSEPSPITTFRSPAQLEQARAEFMDRSEPPSPAQNYAWRRPETESQPMAHGQRRPILEPAEVSDPTPPRGRASSRTRYKIGLAFVAALLIWGVAQALSPAGVLDNTITDDEARIVETNPLVDENGEALIAAGTLVAEPGQEEGQLQGFGKSTSEGESSDGGADDGSTMAADGSSSAGSDSMVETSSDYNSNLELIHAATVRNRNHDDSPYRTTPSASLVLENHYGPRSEYVNSPGDNPEHAFPTSKGGQFRAACEFSHFSYDDPLVYPGRPGASHLHMHFGNTDVNAFSTYDTLINSGSSTCNGQELNRTGYWVPAMFDSQGNVRVPERIVVYYKGEGQSRGKSNVYPEGAAMIATKHINEIPPGQGGAKGKFSFVCSDNFSGANSPASNTMANCNGSRFKEKYGVDDNPRVVLEMNVKFPHCWNGKDPSNPDNFDTPSGGGWYGSNCTGEFNQNLPNLEYFVNYKVDIGEDTSGWYLSSDVDPTTYGAGKATGGSSIHGDWWGGWNKQVNKMFIDNCVNTRTESKTLKGCGFGYLTDGGPSKKAPLDGPALKLRPQYTGPQKVPASEIFAELCPQPSHQFSRAEDAAYCAPGTGF